MCRPGRRYDIKIEIRGNSVKGYLDSKLIQEVSDTCANVKSVCTSAARDDKSGDIILKVVNASSQSLETQINLKGAGKLTGKGKAIMLTSATLDENTFEEPMKISPKLNMIQFSGNILIRSFPGNSLTIIRLATAGGKK
jgi:alpha-L-arabinofuranosidase